MSYSIPLMMHSMGHLERHKTALIGDKVLFAISEALGSFKKQSTEAIPGSHLKSFTF